MIFFRSGRRRLKLGLPTHLDVEDTVQQGKMCDLDKTIGVTRHEEIYIAKPTKRIIRIEPAEGVKQAISLTRHRSSVQDVLRAAGATNGDDHITRSRMPF